MPRPAWLRAPVQPSGSAEAGAQAHRRRYGSWCSSRRASDRWPDFESPFCAGCVLVCPDDGCVDHHVLEVGIVGQRLEKTLPTAFARPSQKASVHAVPLAELIRQIAPRCPRPQDPKHGIDEQTIVLTAATLVALLAGNQLLDTL